MEKANVVPMSKEDLEQTLSRLRKKMVTIKDDYDVVSLAIRTIELDLHKIETEDKAANEVVEQGAV